MSYIVLIVLTLLSCLLFEFAGLPGNVSKLVSSYKQQFKLMADKAIPDEEKQQLLFGQIGQQLLLLLKLILGIALFVAPFLSLYGLQYLNDALNPGILITLEGILVPSVVVIFYIIIKRNYGHLFQKR